MINLSKFTLIIIIIIMNDVRLFKVTSFIIMFLIAVNNFFFFNLIYKYVTQVPNNPPSLVLLQDSTWASPQELAPKQGQKSTIKELRKATWALIRYPSPRQVTFAIAKEVVY